MQSTLNPHFRNATSRTTVTIASQQLLPLSSSPRCRSHGAGEMGETQTARKICQTILPPRHPSLLTRRLYSCGHGEAARHGFVADSTASLGLLEGRTPTPLQMTRPRASVLVADPAPTIRARTIEQIFPFARLHAASAENEQSDSQQHCDYVAEPDQKFPHQSGVSSNPARYVIPKPLALPRPRKEPPHFQQSARVAHGD